jgi:hypothetical protein
MPLSNQSLFGAFLFLTYFLQDSLGFSPLNTGFAFLPMTAGLVVGAGLCNTMPLPRFGPNRVALAEWAARGRGGHHSTDGCVTIVALVSGGLSIRREGIRTGAITDGETDAR